MKRIKEFYHKIMRSYWYRRSVKMLDYAHCDNPYDQEDERWSIHHDKYEKIGYKLQGKAKYHEYKIYEHRISEYDAR